MKNFNRIFKDAERLHPSEGLWARIESDVLLKGSLPEARSDSGRGGSGPIRFIMGYKLAASAALAAGLVTGGLFLQHRSELEKKAHADTTATAPIAGNKTGNSMAQPALEVLDPELLVWAADLGEWNTDTDESAEEVL